MNDSPSAKQLIEAFLFSTNEPLSLAKFKKILFPHFSLSFSSIRTFLEDLEKEYESQKRAFQIEENKDGFFLRIRSSLQTFVLPFLEQKKPEKLSKAALEVLAIIAFKQPITKTQVESIRGVDSSGILYHLIEKNFIEIAGKLEAPGKPSLYQITSSFLNHFGLISLEDLKKMNLENPAKAPVT